MSALATVHSRAFSTLGVVFKDAVWGEQGAGLNSDWTLLKPLYKLLRFWQVGAESHSSCGAQDKPYK